MLFFWAGITGLISHLISLVFIVMAIEAEEFPIAAVRRIVVVIVVLMMDRELVQFLAVKFSAAVGADPGKEFKGLLAKCVFHVRRVTSCYMSFGADREWIGLILPQV